MQEGSRNHGSESLCRWRITVVFGRAATYGVNNGSGKKCDFI
jgi:hypothetical protein